MIVYIANEISVRELSSNLLLAVIAASKGHQTMIGSFNDILLCKRINILPLGPLIVKNMNIPPISKCSYDKFLNTGFELYCHEQEPAILYSDFDLYIKRLNITPNQFMPFKGVFCWGERDHGGYTKLFNNKKHIFHITGAPRIDLWRPELKSFWLKSDLNNLKPYILYVSNNGYAVGKNHWTENLNILNSLELMNDKEAELNIYKTIQKDIVMVQNAVFTLRDLASKYKNINFVIRPHPADNESYWKAAIGKHENIHVIYQGSLTPWIAGAKAVIHNSCSSALEAAIQGVPVISYVPTELCDVLDIPNKLGTRVSNHHEIKAAVEHALTQSDARQMTSDSHTLLEPLLAIDKELASQKIIALIEQSTEINKANKISQVNFIKISMALKTKAAIDKVRGLYLHDAANLFDRREVIDQIRKVSEILGLPAPKVRFVSNTTILIG
jgi:surface carbohydrate biosynthesis protein